MNSLRLHSLRVVCLVMCTAIGSAIVATRAEAAPATPKPNATTAPAPRPTTSDIGVIGTGTLGIHVGPRGR